MTQNGTGEREEEASIAEFERAEGDEETDAAEIEVKNKKKPTVVAESPEKKIQLLNLIDMRHILGFLN